MKPPAIGKYAFRVRTRRGIVMDVLLPGRDPMEAERKLRQIYHDCEVIARRALHGGGVPPNLEGPAPPQSH